MLLKPALAELFSLEFEWSQLFSCLPNSPQYFEDIYNPVVFMVSFLPLNSKSSSPFINPLRIVLGTQITIGVTVIFMLHCCFFFILFLWKFLCTYLSFFFFDFWSLSDNKSPQVSTAVLSILAVLKNSVVWMVSTRPTTSNSGTEKSTFWQVLFFFSLLFFC